MARVAEERALHLGKFDVVSPWDEQCRRALNCQKNKSSADCSCKRVLHGLEQLGPLIPTDNLRCSRRTYFAQKRVSSLSAGAGGALGRQQLP